MASKSNVSFYVALSLATLLICNTAALAQFSGNIQGVISDSSGAAINDASVGLRNLDTGVTATTTTSDSGNYRFSSLAPGRYVVKADASGFQSKEVKPHSQHRRTAGPQHDSGGWLQQPVGDGHSGSSGA